MQVVEINDDHGSEKRGDVSEKRREGSSCVRGDLAAFEPSTGTGGISWGLGAANLRATGWWLA